MSTITYADVVNVYGEKRALGVLLSVEQAARIEPAAEQDDETTRFQRALDALSEINFAELNS